MPELHTRVDQADTNPTRSQSVAAEITSLIRSKHTLIWITTREEARVEEHLINAAIAAKYVPRIWDCASGITEASGTRENPNNLTRGIDDLFTKIEANSEGRTPSSDRGCWILRDAHEWLTGPIGIASRRQLRNLARFLQTCQTAQTIILLTPSSNIPDELLGHTTFIEWPLPDRNEIGQILDDTVEMAKTRMEQIPTNGTREAAIDAAIGLSGDEVANCYSKSVVTKRKIDPHQITSEKKRIITREKVLEWIDPLPGGLDSVGGLGELKSWMNARKVAYTKQFRNYAPNLRPKGILLVGPPGCGKTLVGKAIATALESPLLKWDFGSLKGKYVGESEGKIRRAKLVAETIGRSVILFDEMEKGLAGGTNAADGGVSADQIGFMLGWMQERTSDAFFVATANDISNLPPELLRKGRFDAIFFVDAPNETERAEIIRAAMKEQLLDPDTIDAGEISLATLDFSGAEIASLVSDALYAAFPDNARPINTADLVAAARKVSPYLKTPVVADRVSKLREWATAGGAIFASSPQETTQTTSRFRQLDI